MAKKLSKVLLYLIVILGAITMLIPFLWMISTSLKTAPETIAVPPIWIPKALQWSNYVDSSIGYSRNLSRGVVNQ